ncbi:hypothetical protein ACFC6U_03165 [Kitasatospora purpeofusca]|uniref:hypothetical protein n=1 Tax=Kitasatospora purpeofusca TaxID=67352 RepID=UPI0035D5AFCE
MATDERNRWTSFGWRRDLFAPVSVAQSLVAGIGVVLLVALSGTAAFALSEWRAETIQAEGAFGSVLKAADLYPLILPGLCALVLAALAVSLSVAAVFGGDDPHQGSRRRCACRRCRWGHWTALELRRPLFDTESMLGTAVTALVAALAADAVSAAGLGLFPVVGGHLPLPLRIAVAIPAFLLLMAGTLATWAIVPGSLLAASGVFHARNNRIWWQENGNAAELAPLAVYESEGETVPGTADMQEQVFLQFMDSNLLPKRITGQGETTETFRLLGVDVQDAAAADVWGLVPAEWPDGWQLVRQGAGSYWFDLVDESGTPMIEGFVNCKAYDPQAHLRLTPAGRREVRRRWYGLSDKERTRVQRRGGPWKPLYPTVAAGPHFDARDNYALVASRLRAKGWTIGAEEATGVQIILSEAASAWAAERRAGDSLWLLPSGISDMPHTGCAGAGTYPWRLRETQTSWRDPGALADEINRILREGYPDELTPEEADADTV